MIFEEEEESEDEPEPEKFLDPEEAIYTGHPDDRKALMAHRSWVRSREEHISRTYQAWSTKTKKKERSGSAAEKSLIRQKANELAIIEAKGKRIKISYDRESFIHHQGLQAGGQVLGMDRYFNMYHYLPEVDPSRIYIEPNVNPDTGKPFHNKSGKYFKANALPQNVVCNYC